MREILSILYIGMLWAVVMVEAGSTSSISPPTANSNLAPSEVGNMNQPFRHGMLRPYPPSNTNHHAHTHTRSRQSPYTMCSKLATNSLDQCVNVDLYSTAPSVERESKVKVVHPPKEESDQHKSSIKIVKEQSLDTEKNKRDQKVAPSIDVNKPVHHANVPIRVIEHSESFNGKHLEVHHKVTTRTDGAIIVEEEVEVIERHRDEPNQRQLNESNRPIDRFDTHQLKKEISAWHQRLAEDERILKSLASKLENIEYQRQLAESAKQQLETAQKMIKALENSPFHEINQDARLALLEILADSASLSVDSDHQRENSQRGERIERAASKDVTWRSIASAAKQYGQQLWSDRWKPFRWVKQAFNNPDWTNKQVSNEHELEIVMTNRAHSTSNGGDRTSLESTSDVEKNSPHSQHNPSNIHYDKLQAETPSEPDSGLLSKMKPIIGESRSEHGLNTGKVDRDSLDRGHNLNGDRDDDHQHRSPDVGCNSHHSDPYELDSPDSSHLSSVASKFEVIHSFWLTLWNRTKGAVNHLIDSNRQLTTSSIDSPHPSKHFLHEHPRLYGEDEDVDAELDTIEDEEETNIDWSSRTRDRSIFDST